MMLPRECTDFVLERATAEAATSTVRRRRRDTAANESAYATATGSTKRW
jgi:hypothetical protein